MTELTKNDTFIYVRFALEESLMIVRRTLFVALVVAAAAVAIWASVIAPGRAVPVRDHRARHPRDRAYAAAVLAHFAPAEEVETR